MSQTETEGGGLSAWREAAQYGGSLTPQRPVWMSLEDVTGVGFLTG